MIVQMANAFILIPIALSFLSVELFGLWMLILQMNVVYQLIDLGFSEAFSRVLIDSKEKGAELYWQTVKTAWVVFGCQALAILVVGLGIASYLPGWLNIPDHLQGLAILLIQIIVANMVWTTLTRVFNQVLVSNQRMDLDNRAGFFGILGSFIFTCSALYLGLGIWSMVLGLIIGNFIVSTLRYTFARSFCSFRFKILKSPFNQKLFKEIFKYGLDRFFATLGDRLLRIIPTFAITRILGLEANAVWGIINRGIIFCESLLCKPIETAYPGLAQMYVSAENQILRKRYEQLVSMMSLGAAVTMVCIAVGLKPAINIWSAGTVVISDKLNLAVAIWFGIIVVKRSFWPVITIPKKMGWAKTSNIIDSSLLAISIFLITERDSSIAIFVALLAVMTFGSSIPYMIYRARSFPEKIFPLEIFRRYIPVILGLLLSFFGWFSLQLVDSFNLMAVVSIAFVTSSCLILISIYLCPVLKDSVAVILKTKKSKFFS